MTSRTKKPTTATSRTVAPTAATRRTRPAANPNPDELADALATKLKIGSKRSTTTTTGTPKDNKTESMRAINSAMQSMTALAQSGWKKSTTDSTATWRSQNAEANKLAISSKEHLATLRSIDGATIEIERAALSVVGKLVAMDMHDAAREALKDTHPSLTKALGLQVDEVPTKLGYLSIPIPSHPIQDSVHLTMISTYLIQALTTACFTGENLDDMSLFILSPNTHCILAWLPSLHPLPAKHIDSILTRTYTALTKACASRPSPKTSSSRTKTTSESSPPSYRSVFLLRGYALLCLVNASPGTVEPDSYWDQVIRFTASFAKSCSEAKDEKRGTDDILETFDKLVTSARGRTDAQRFLDGTKFLTFCDYWITFAKRAGDICILDRIGSIMQKRPSSSRKASQSTPKTESKEEETKQPGLRDAVLEGTKLCGLLAQCVTLVDKVLDGSAPNEDEISQSLRSCNTAIQKSTCLPLLLLGDQAPAEKENEDFVRISGKVDRALERLRRCCHKLIEARDRSTELKSLASSLVKTCVDALQDLLVEKVDVDFRTDITTRTIDSLFVLGRTSLDIANPQTYIPAYDYLDDALKVIDTISQDGRNEGIDTANYLRCISGAFYNLAGSLYQNARYGAAVPFLKQTCSIGARALEEHRTVDNPNSTKGKEKAKEREAEWLQLEQQLYRRWELLAVCYLKNGDRKNSYDAFTKCIHTFPFSSTGLATETDTNCLSTIFAGDQNATLKALSSLLDRVSYVGACELLLPPDQVSLYQSLTPPNSKLDLRIVGILLEYQYESLYPHRWKDGARPVLLQLLRDMLQVYGTKDDISGFLMPIRRARTLVKCLELVYRDEEETSVVGEQLGYESVDKVGEAAVALLSKADLSHDAGLAIYKTQYAVSAHLWLANLAHRQSSPNLLAEVSKHVDEANALLEVLQNDVTRKAAKSQRKTSVSNTSPAVARRGVSPRASKISSPKAPRITRMRGPPPAPRKAPAMRRAPVAASKAKVVAQAPVTPKAKSRSGLQSVALNAEKTPPRPSLDGKASLTPMPFDDFSKFHDLLMLTTRILGLLSLVLPRFQLLAFLRKLCQRQLGTSSEEFIVASLELAYEYAKLGKLRRASSVFSTALEIVRSGETSPEIAAFFLLRFSETLALMNDVPRSSAVYLEAFEHSDRILGENKGMSSLQKIQSRARRLELSAMACRVFALIQISREDATLALSSLHQSLRLWNRAIDTTSRLARSSSKPSDTSNQNPFEASAANDSTASADQSQGQAKVKSSGKSSTEFQWRLLEGLVLVLFSLSETYLTRGSPREAEYFLKQVQTLAEASGLPVIESRASTRLVEVQLGLGKLEEAAALLDDVAAKLGESVVLDSVDYQRLLSRFNERAEEQDKAAEISMKALEMLQRLNGDFQRVDGFVMGLRRSLEGQDAGGEFIVPELLSKILARYIWLLRGNGDQEFDDLLTKLCSLPPSLRIEAQKNSLLANLMLHKVHQRFQSDMFLNSLTESTIAIPMGMSSRTTAQRVVPIQDVLAALDSAEKYFQESITLTAKAGDVVHFRNAAVSLTLVKAFQTSLGRLDDLSAAHSASLLDASSAITLRREMLEAIQQKLASLKPSDDFEWPRITADGVPLPQSPGDTKKRRPMLLGDSDLESDDDEPADEDKIKKYWQAVQERYQAKLLDGDSLRDSQTKDLPSNWTVIHVHLVEDNSTLLISRQECGEGAAEPMLFCIPLKGRRDNGTGDDEEHLSFEDAIAEFMEIIRLSNESTKAAVHVRVGDEEARANWWKERNALDVRLKELLENIEFCWLGAFKTILSPRSNVKPNQLDELRVQFDKVFQRNLQVKEKKPKAHTGHKKAASQAQAPSQVFLDDAMLRCFSSLSPKCRDEELEDLLYFVLDLYQFHGVPVLTAEVDSMQAVVDLRSVLEEHNGRLSKAKTGGRAGASNSMEPEEHVFLVLDKNVQGLPWESLPILRGRSVSRIPSIDFLQDRIAFAALRREQRGMQDTGDGTAVVDPKNGYFILNPSGDLTKTQGRFEEWVDGMKKVGWEGVVGEAVTEHQFSEALKNRDLVVYFGHGGGEQYIRSQRIRGLPTCAATMLWGCSSGHLKDMGEFDRIGTPYNYMLGGCPTLIANLWDVTDRDIDKFSLAVFDKIGLHGQAVASPQPKRGSMSVVTAVAQSREVCKLKYLTGAAPVVYGIPFHL